MNEQKLQAIFADTLGLGANDITDALAYNHVPQWDSIAHMTLIAAIEEGFGIMMDTQDVIDMSTFSKAKQIVAKYL